MGGPVPGTGHGVLTPAALRAASVPGGEHSAYLRVALPWRAEGWGGGSLAMISGPPIFLHRKISVEGCSLQFFF